MYTYMSHFDAVLFFDNIADAYSSLKNRRVPIFVEDSIAVIQFFIVQNYVKGLREFNGYPYWYLMFHTVCL
jgi:hypothetical protein